MNVQASDTVLAALDRRLQVDRVLAVDPLAEVARSSRPPPDPHTAGAAAPASRAALAVRLPLGQVVTARVVDVPQPGHVIADIGSLRIAMAWPMAGGVAPQPGADIALRVLTHEPMLLFQSADSVVTTDDAGPRWSDAALSLQPHGTRPTRFEIPILQVVRHGEAAIALDDGFVAQRAPSADDAALPPLPKAADDPSTAPSPFMPLVLQGPAWPGQPMELVIHRDRDDDQLDNPVLDHWCGEVVIDLPHLGRVAGHLSFSMQGLRIRLEGDDARTVAAMSAATAELATAFAGADLHVSALSVGRPAADAGRRDARTAAATSGIDVHG